MPNAELSHTSDLRHLHLQQPGREEAQSMLGISVFLSHSFSVSLSHSLTLSLSISLSLYLSPPCFPHIVHVQFFTYTKNICLLHFCIVTHTPALSTHTHRHTDTHTHTHPLSLSLH